MFLKEGSIFKMDMNHFNYEELKLRSSKHREMNILSHLGEAQIVMVIVISSIKEQYLNRYNNKNDD